MAEFIRHEKYDRNSKQNDIAVIRLAGTVKFTSTVRPACLSQSNNLSEQKATGMHNNYISVWFSFLENTLLFINMSSNWSVNMNYSQWLGKHRICFEPRIWWTHESTVGYSRQPNMSELFWRLEHLWKSNLFRRFSWRTRHMSRCLKVLFNWFQFSTNWVVISRRLRRTTSGAQQLHVQYYRRNIFWHRLWNQKLTRNLHES